MTTVDSSKIEHIRLPSNTKGIAKLRKGLGLHSYGNNITIFDGKYRQVCSQVTSSSVWDMPLEEFIEYVRSAGSELIDPKVQLTAQREYYDEYAPLVEVTGFMEIDPEIVEQLDQFREIEHKRAAEQAKKDRKAAAERRRQQELKAIKDLEKKGYKVTKDG